MAGIKDHHQSIIDGDGALFVLPFFPNRTSMTDRYFLRSEVNDLKLLKRCVISMIFSLYHLPWPKWAHHATGTVIPSVMYTTYRTDETREPKILMLLLNIDELRNSMEPFKKSTTVHFHHIDIELTEI